MKYAAELTAGVRFYPRGEERSAQIDDFVAAGGTAAPAQRLRQRGFFGVNHMSKEEARAQAMQFQDISATVAVLDAAHEDAPRARDPVIFLQNVVADRLLGMGVKDAFRIFHDHDHGREKHDAEPGFITMNMPMPLDTLGIEHPIVRATFKDRLPGERRGGRLFGDPEDPQDPRHRDVGLRLRRHPAARGDPNGWRRKRASR